MVSLFRPGRDGLALIAVRSIVFLSILVPAIAVPSIASAGARGPQAMTPVDMVELPRLRAPALSPDGTMLLYLRSETDWAENAIVNRYRLLDLETGRDLPVFEPASAAESYGPGVWAPDSSGFITLLTREGDDHRQAYFYSIADGALQRLTSHPADVDDVAWAPDGESFYFRAEDQREEETRRLVEEGWAIDPYDAARPAGLWRQVVGLEKARPLVAGKDHIREYAISRDGARILYAEAPGALIDDRHRGELWLYDIAAGKRRRLTRNDYHEDAAKLSPSGDAFAFIAQVNGEGEYYYEDNLFVQAVGDSAPRVLFPQTPIQVLDFHWDAAGDGFYILGNIGLRTELFYYGLEEGVLTRWTQGDHVLADWSYDPALDAHTARVVSAASPGEIYIARDLSRGFESATSDYGGIADAYRLPRQEAVRWRGRGGVEIEGLLAYPVGHREGERFPLVTITHGGPRASSQFGSWNASRYLPVLTGLGYGVFLPNHRGGTGYGDAFMRDMVGGYFTNAQDDILRGVDYLIDRGLADPDRLIKMGWSAGGHMTNKLITLTDRFRAASSGAGAGEWVSMYGESDTRYGRTPWFGGPPWSRDAPLDAYRDQSPITRAWRVATPTLFFVGEKDLRVPPTQSILMHRAVKAAGAPTALYIAEDEPHNFRKPAHQLFKINTELTWFARHALGVAYAPVLPAAAYAPPDGAASGEGVGAE